MSKWYLGLNTIHNSSTALLKDGEIVYHSENERFSGIKYDGFPYNSISQITKFTDHIDKMAHCGTPLHKVEDWYPYDVYTSYVQRLSKSFFNTGFEILDASLDHHKLHASCAFYNSGFTKALCIVIDAAGAEFHFNVKESSQKYYGREVSTAFIAEYPATFTLVDKHVAIPYKLELTPDVENHISIKPYISPAGAFGIVSKQFGFNTLDAGKVMGMSSYGKLDNDIPPIYINDEINSELFYIYNDSLHDVAINKEKFPHLYTDDFQKNANLARALQDDTQQKVAEYIVKMVEKTGIKDVCLSGGYFLNCVANYFYLANISKDINIYVEPISSDAGLSIGAVKLMWHSDTQDCTIRKQVSISYGIKHQISVTDKLNDTEFVQSVTYNEVAKLLANKNIVAIYQHGSESGPRALGNRSILYDPRDTDGRDHVNTVKNREWFRPFAGSVLLEDVHEWFDMRGLAESPFMMFAVNVLDDKKMLIPSVTHVDGTCRVQTVSHDQNPHFYNLISEFKKETGIPLLFNTSFNLAGDPLVETVDDAFSTFRNSKINYLYFPEPGLLVGKS
jgi:carbamoyltransferase